MNTYHISLLVLLLALLGVSACSLIDPYDSPAFPTIHLEEEAHLTDDPASPFCEFSIDYTYPNEKNDTIAGLINRSIQREFLGDDYADLMPEVAVDSFKNTYLRQYRTETGELYRADVAKHGTEGIPHWYDQTYSLVTFVEEGHDNVLNASANYYVDKGGAHPNQWSRWLNFHATDGKLLTKEDVFLPSAKAEIEQILLDQLIRKVAKLHPKENIVSIVNLRKNGYLEFTDIYIPDNFLLGKENILFLFNRYDIAPYAFGEIVLEVPYGEIGHCLKK